MATSSSLIESEKKSLEELKKKAYIPNQLPEDFLRVILKDTNTNEDNDSLLAQQLYYDLNKQSLMQYNSTLYNQPRPQIDYGRGRLQIDVVEAKLMKNYGLARMDPYVRIIMGRKVLETPTAYNGSKNPIWRKTIFCNLPHNVDTLTIEIYDEKSFSEDELIAFVKYPLPKNLFDGILVDEWIPLSGKLGEQKEGYINIHLFFTSIEALRTQNLRNRPPTLPASSVSSSSSTGTSTSNSPNARQQSIIQPGSVHLPPEMIEIQENRYTEDDFKSIKEMFPSFEDEIIKSVLESSSNKESAIEALLQMVADS